MARPVVYPEGLDYFPETDDGLVNKYRVFRDDPLADFPPPMHAEFQTDDRGWVTADEVTAFTFVLKPNHDHHARVALSAYAASCAIEKPQLSKDLYDLLSQDEWGSD